MATQDGFANARDVGGLDVSGGHHVRAGVLYRSDAPFVTDGIPIGLSPWPPHTVIDLRSADELGDAHPLSEQATTVVALPLSARAELAKYADSIERIDLPTLYAIMLREKADLMVRVAELVAEAPGPVLVHCTAGKDRTGVAVATVLAAVGVPRDEIIADYVATAGNMGAVRDRMIAGGPRGEEESRKRVNGIPKDLMGAPGVAIETVLDAFDAHPNGAAGWLLDHGLRPDTLQLLTERLVD